MAGEPMEIILARNFISRITTPAILTIPGGTLIFFNEAAGILLGSRFEESGRMPVEEWYTRWGPFNEDGSQEPFDQLGLTVAARQKHEAAHSKLYIRPDNGKPQEVNISVLPLMGANGYQGVIGFFWPTADEAEA
jgi:hypothetical protein